jgi:hypothetical protein
MSGDVRKTTRFLSLVIVVASLVATCEMMWSRATCFTMRSKLFGLIGTLLPPSWYLAIIPVLCVVGILVANAQKGDRSVLAFKVAHLFAIAFFWYIHRVLATEEIRGLSWGTDVVTP